MELKRILVPFDGDPNDIRALRTALLLAKARAAHVEAWHVSQDPVEIVTRRFCYSPFVDEAVGDTTVNELRRSDARQMMKAEKAFGCAAHFFRVPQAQPGAQPHGASASFHTTIGNPSRVISERGRLCDLTVACPNGSPRFSQVLMSILIETGRPLLLVPRDKSEYQFNGRIVVAWNGSREAAHAVSFAMPMLERARVWIVARKTGFPMRTSDRELASYLDQHQVEIEPLPRDVKFAALGDAVLHAAKAVDAGLIVMGAYGHNGPRELVSGGVTDDILKKADIPVLLAH